MGGAWAHHAGSCLSAVVGAVLLGVAARATAAPAWTLLAGSTVTRGVTFDCVPVSSPLLASKNGRHVAIAANRAAARPGVGAAVCTGEVIVAYNVLPDLSVQAATLQGPCTTTQWYTVCHIDLPVYQSARFTTELSLGPYGREAGRAYVTLPAPSANFTIPISVSTEGTLSATQSTAVVVPGLDESAPAILTVHNSGPSGATGVSVSEVLPAFITAAPSGACQFNPGSNTVSCAWDRIDPGGTLQVPLRLSAKSGYPSSQLQTSLQLNSELSRSSSNATILVSGQAVIGEQSFDPQPAVQMGKVTDTVTIHLLPAAMRKLPTPGIPVAFKVSFPAGLNVQGLKIGPAAAKMHCTATGHDVQCEQPTLGGDEAGSDAEVGIVLYPTVAGKRTVLLEWTSEQRIHGSSTYELDVRPTYSDAR